VTIWAAVIYLNEAECRGGIMPKTKKAEQQMKKLNKVIETLACLEFEDMKQVEKVVQAVRWDLSFVNLDLNEILSHEGQSMEAA
jgi:hypothetical protein